MNLVIVRVASCLSLTRLQMTYGCGKITFKERFMTTGKKAGQAAGKTLKAKGQGKKGKSAAGSALAQRSKHKGGKK